MYRVRHRIQKVRTIQADLRLRKEVRHQPIAQAVEVLLHRLAEAVTQSQEEVQVTVVAVVLDDNIISK